MKNIIEKQKNLKPTLTIAIPAYNEESTIKNLLRDVLAQNRHDFVLDRIVIYFDGCTDKTIDSVKSMQKNAPEISIVESSPRRGKIYRLNQIFQDFSSDFLVVLDADVGLVGKTFFDTFIGAAISDPSGKMFAAHQKPLRPRNLVGRLIYASFAMWDDIRFSVPSKDHVQNFYGAATLYEREFAKKLNIPNEATEERVYLYLMAKKEEGFRYVNTATVCYWPPCTWYDFFKHADRTFGTDQPAINKIFGDIAGDIHIIPWRFKLIGIFKSFLRDPLYAPFALILNFLLSRLTLKKPVRNSALWEVAKSTKLPIKQFEMQQKIIFSSYDDIKNPAYSGGGAIAIHEVAKRLSKKYNVTVLCGNYNGAKNENIDGVDYMHIGLSFLSPRLSQLFFHLTLSLYVLTERCDLWIESFTPPFSTSFTPWFTKKPVIALVHMLSAKDMARKYHLPFSIIENFGIKLYRHFIVLTEESAEQIKKLNPDAGIKIIGNGVHLPELPYQLSNNAGHLSFIGRIEFNQKGLDFLLKAYTKIVEKNYIPLVIAGSGAEKEVSKMKKLIRDYRLDDKIILAGHVAGAKKEKFFRNTLIGIIPSRFETFSLAALEMMSYGIPTVVFDIPGVKWIPQGAGVKVAPFDENALAEAILKLLQDKNYYKQIALKARIEAEKYNWNDIGMAYDRFILEILNK